MLAHENVYPHHASYVAKHLVRFWSTTPGLGLLVLALLLSACTSSVPLQQPPSAGAGQNHSSATVSEANSGKEISSGESAVKPVVVGSPAANYQSPDKLPDVIYFDFDSFTINADAMPIVEGYAKLLSNKPAQRLLLEGHTDEQGGREYNLALGQKRAESVLRALVVLGASSQQLEPLSMGEEQPAVQGNEEAAWSKNRRVQFRLNKTN